jgi:hypothetical protein
MTDLPENQNRGDGEDAELSRALRNEVPSAGPSYWEQIDARLAAAAGERPAPDSEQVIHLDHSSDQGDTAAPVIRLTDMNTTTPSPTPTRGLVLALAAVAALIVGIAGFAGFATLRDSAPTPVESAGTVDETRDINDADADSAETVEAPHEPTEPPAEEAGEDVTLDYQPPVEQRCFFEQYLPEDEPDPSVVWLIEVEGGDFRALLEFPVADGEISQTFDSGTFDADGLGQAGEGVVIQLFDSGASRSLDEIEPFTATEVDCSSIADVEERFARLADGPTARLLPDTEPAG